MRETIHIELMSQTPNKWGECGNYSTTITLEVSREDAKAIIDQIVTQLAEQFNEQLCADNGYNIAVSDPCKVFRLVSPTRDVKGNRYCFSAEYTVDVKDYVDSLAEADIEADV